MAAFLADLHHAANIARTFGAAGGPWEFNLRDLLRWCQLAESAVPAGGAVTAEGAAQVMLLCAPPGTVVFMQGRWWWIRRMLALPKA
jgi:Midasin AAA lid domain